MDSDIDTGLPQNLRLQHIPMAAFEGASDETLKREASTMLPAYETAADQKKRRKLEKKMLIEQTLSPAGAQDNGVDSTQATSDSTVNTADLMPVAPGITYTGGKVQMTYTSGLVLGLTQQVNIVKPFGHGSAKKWVTVAERLVTVVDDDPTASHTIRKNNELALAFITREAREAIAKKNSSHTNPLTAAFKKYYNAWRTGTDTKAVGPEISPELAELMASIQEYKDKLDALKT